eukprot:CAMPEP_0168356306 /NCGR_PEP_ID=MMETSP0213-20121227/25074_1 /TAXON_ID=151035 /ORGANISM="Euplotes harpa, Strain FSP1.4" /LENGTH=141 /DNA_ID=CAMNT_0008368695 /DNA_START=339 /DNA_END=764 /DNA_ORIENTATION=+
MSFQQLNTFNDEDKEVSRYSNARFIDECEDDVRKFKSIGDSIVSHTFLPFADNATTDFQVYFENTVQYNIEDEAIKVKGTRGKPSKEEILREARNYTSYESNYMGKVFAYQHISYEVDYFETAFTLLDELILIYNKMYDNR